MIQRQGRVDGWPGQAGDARRLGLPLGAHISPSIPEYSSQHTRELPVTVTYRASAGSSCALLLGAAMAIDDAAG